MWQLISFGNMWLLYRSWPITHNAHDDDLPILEVVRYQFRVSSNGLTNSISELIRIKRRAVEGSIGSSGGCSTSRLDEAETLCADCSASLSKIIKNFYVLNLMTLYTNISLLFKKWAVDIVWRRPLSFELVSLEHQALIFSFSSNPCSFHKKALYLGGWVALV